MNINKNYITIQGWMVSEFSLKGNDLLIYSIIYGFTQDGESRFTGSLRYLATWTNSTKSGVIKNLKSLQEKGLIGKEENFFNGMKLVKYYATKLHRGMQQSCMGGMQQSTPNTIESNKIVILKKQNPTIEEIKDYCKLRQNNVDAKKFFDYYEAGDWTDLKGNKVKSWKQRIITWENNSNDSTPPKNKAEDSQVDLVNEIIGEDIIKEITTEGSEKAYLCLSKNKETLITDLSSEKKSRIKEVLNKNSIIIKYV